MTKFCDRHDFVKKSEKSEISEFSGFFKKIGKIAKNQKIPDFGKNPENREKSPGSRKLAISGPPQNPTPGPRIRGPPARTPSWPGGPGPGPRDLTRDPGRDPRSRPGTPDPGREAKNGKKSPLIKGSEKRKLVRPAQKKWNRHFFAPVSRDKNPI